jgi:hypothetical protein
VHTLFRHQRLEHDLVRLQVQFRFLSDVLWHGSLYFVRGKNAAAV